jgi:hypothetical protein
MFTERVKMQKKIWYKCMVMVGEIVNTAISVAKMVNHSSLIYRIGKMLTRNKH